MRIIIRNGRKKLIKRSLKVYNGDYNHGLMPTKQLIMALQGLINFHSLVTCATFYLLPQEWRTWEIAQIVGII